MKNGLAPLLIVSGICKRNAFYCLETLISYRAPQLCIFLQEEFKERNAIQLFKSDVRKLICNE